MAFSEYLNFMVAKVEIICLDNHSNDAPSNLVSNINLHDLARMNLQLPLPQWGASNIYLLVLFSWKVNIAENPIAAMGL